MLLLLATCVWIVREAVQRLTSGGVTVEVTFWSFAVMATSILVDASRSRVLYAVAKKHRSQALEADALHFASDVWSSAVVIVGLVSAKLGFAAGDAIAALGVSAVVIWASVRLGRRTIDALLDTAPAGMEQRVAQIVAAVPGVHDCHNLRIRWSGPVLFIDLHVLVDGRQTLAEAHRLTDEIEEKIREIAPEADVTVHPEPV
jgi:cation diffusion facilitator family transporter